MRARTVRLTEILEHPTMSLSPRDYLTEADEVQVGVEGSPCPWGHRGTEDCTEFGHPGCDGSRCDWGEQS